MKFVGPLRKMYRRSIHWQWLDQQVYRVLDTLTNLYSWLRHYSFPQNYIRRWKLNMLWELYEQETVALCKKTIKPGMIVVDISAHIGYFTRIFSKLVGTSGVVYAFEADAENFELLAKNTKHLPNVRRFHFALGDQLGIIDFYHCIDKSGCHTTIPDIPTGLLMTKTSVQSNTLDNILKQENIPVIHVIKIDIEGGESAAFRGMRETLRQNRELTIITEFSPMAIGAAKINPIIFLHNFIDEGFNIYAIENHGLIPVQPKNYQDFIPSVQNATDAYKQSINILCIRK